MTDLPPVQYLDEAAQCLAWTSWNYGAEHSSEAPAIIAHARALHENAQLRAEIAALRPRETLEQVARREAERAAIAPNAVSGFYVGFLRAAEMAKAGELPDE